MNNQMTELDSIGARAAAKVRALGKIKDNLDSRSALASQELAQVWDALERGETVNDCKTKKEWAKHWSISDRMCRYILRGRAKRTGEHRNRTVPLDKLESKVVSFEGRKFTLQEVGLPQAIPGNRDGAHVAELILVPVEEKKEEKPAPKEKKERLRHITNPPFATALCGDITLNRKNTAKGKRFPVTCEKCIELARNLTPDPSKKKDERKTHVLGVGIFADGRTACGKMPGDTVTVVAHDPTCRNCWIASRDGYMKREPKQVAIVLNDECQPEEAL